MAPLDLLSLVDERQHAGVAGRRAAGGPVEKMEGCYIPGGIIPFSADLCGTNIQKSMSLSFID